jgi:hypothetical protein
MLLIAGCPTSRWDCETWDACSAYVLSPLLSFRTSSPDSLLAELSPTLAKNASEGSVNGQHIARSTLPPTLRKVREGWGTHCASRASKIKSLGHRPRSQEISTAEL